MAEPAVARVLGAATLFGRLGLPDESADPGAVRQQYRKLALLVHPDKCTAQGAKEAFQALSEAFERLSSPAGQAAHLLEVARGRPAPAAGRGEAWGGARAEGAQARWWDTRTWEEFEERLRHRDRAEAALRRQFAGRVAARLAGRRLRGQVRAAERSVEHCDRGAGLAESGLWPPESRRAGREAEEEARAARERAERAGVLPGLEPELPNFDERPELDDPEAAMARLLDLVTHLRTVHLYCLHCGCRYDSPDDMARNCPGVTEEEHEGAAAVGMVTSEETALAPVGEGGGEAPGGDPLEAYMAEVDAALEREDSARRKRRRR
ncbi:unnamed protein product [Prorocentrum cordatum]|uniref:J domain-containing protein n=1 Tax=Prorocentrum cordatum TaxID=2364126 RepID=A0ABN9UW84_9DINO|nr:unnamed protein product [Polarella glacialis]